MDPGIYFVDETKWEAGSSYDGIYLYINDDRTNFWDYKTTIDYDIVRLYVRSINSGANRNGAWQGYLFDKSRVNYLDCNDDGTIDENDRSCQQPDKFLLWLSGNANGNSQDDLNYVVKQGYYAMYIYNNGEKIGDDDGQSRIVFDQNDELKVFVGAMNAYRIDLDNDTKTNVLWYKARKKYRYWLGDFDECIYTPNIYPKETSKAEGEDKILMGINYLNSATRKAMCDNDWKISFEYNLTQRGDGTDGNATEGVDYEAENYNGSFEFSRSCSKCGDESCLHPKEFNITDIKFLEDKLDEGDELFDINFTNFINSEGDDIVFTIKDVPPPKTLTGVFDIYDTDRADKNNDKSGKIGDDENEDRNITTKIVGKEFSLTIGSFSVNDSNKLEAHTEDVDGDSLYLKYGLLSCKEANSTIDECDEIYVSDQEVLDDKEVDKSFKVDEAVKYGAAFVKACTYKKSEDEIELYSYDKCDGNTQCQDSDGNEQKCIRKLMSSDKFAIRPEKFVISEIPDEVRAGEEFNVSFVAKDANDNSSSNYNAYLDDNEVELEYSDAKCETGNLY
jgi:hypothetical protein